MRRFSAVLAVAALALAACGSDSDSGGGSVELSGADQELADALSADIVADDDGLADAFDPDCLAAGTVSVLGGADRIASEYGVTVDNPSTDGVDLSADDAAKVAASYADCGDLKQAFAVGFTSDGDMTTEQAECVLEDISSDEIQDMLEETFQGNDEGPASDALFEKMFEKFATCAE